MASAHAVRLSPSAEKQKLKLELLRGLRPKLESLPVSVVVHEPLVRAGCTFFGTATRRTLTRLHRKASGHACDDQSFDTVPNAVLVLAWPTNESEPRSRRSELEKGDLRDHCCIRNDRAPYLPSKMH